jgi:hypothetical protein
LYRQPEAPRPFVEWKGSGGRPNIPSVELVLARAFLHQQALCQAEQTCKAKGEALISGDFARHIAVETPEIGLQPLELPSHAPHLTGMGIAPHLHGCALG